MNEPISILRDADIFDIQATKPEVLKPRPTAKAIVRDNEGNIALLSADGHSLFPGGGVEEGESNEEACIRECKEEIGCDVVIQDYIGRYDQERNRDGKLYQVYFYVCEVVGEKGKPTTKQKGELACKLTWHTEGEVWSILESQIEAILQDHYAAQFNCRTHRDVFKRYLYTRMGI